MMQGLREKMLSASIRKSISITVTEECNLNCIYCYENNKSNKSIDFQRAIEIIEREFFEMDYYKEIEIAFHGGEPFLKFDLIRQISEYIWSKNWTNKYILHTTTNGTLVHGEIKEWLDNNKQRFWCGLSLDGNRIMHNLNRSNSFDEIDLDFFLKSWPEQPVKMTLSPLSLPHLADGVKYIEDRGFKLSTNAAYGIDWNSEENIHVLERELDKLVIYYSANIELEPSTMVNLPIQRISFTESLSKWCGTGTAMRAYSVDGECYPCHFFDPVTIGKEKAELAKSIEFTNDITEIDPMCKDCVLLAACPTCYGSNFASTGNINLRDKNICKFTKICAKATAYLWVERIKKYGVKELKLDKITYKQLVAAIGRIREELEF